MILRNHGIVVCGETIEEAMYLAYASVKACQHQVKIAFFFFFFFFSKSVSFILSQKFYSNFLWSHIAQLVEAGRGHLNYT